MVLLFIAIVPIFFTQFLVSKSELICDPTVKPWPNFDCQADAKKLLDDLGDDKGTARVLFHRTLEQRKQIRDYFDANFWYHTRHDRGKYGYSHSYKKANLTRDLGKATRYNLDKLYDMAFTSFEDILIGVVRKTITREWKEVGGIEEVLCANDNEMKQLMQDSYQKNYKTTIEEDLKNFNKENKAYQEAMQKYCWPKRCQEKKITKEQAAKETRALEGIDADKDKEKFKNKLKELLKKYSEPDLKLIFQTYRKDEKHGIDTAVEEAFEDKDERRVYEMIVSYVEDTCRCYADELHKAVKGSGKDLDKVHRILLTRCERDLMCVLNNFKSRKDQTFTERLKEEVPTESDYLEAIRYLCGKP